MYIPVKLKSFPTLKIEFAQGYRSDLKLWETKITKYRITYYKYELFNKKTKLDYLNWKVKMQNIFGQL